MSKRLFEEVKPAMARSWFSYVLVILMAVVLTASSAYRVVEHSALAVASTEDALEHGHPHPMAAKPGERQHHHAGHDAADHDHNPSYLAADMATRPSVDPSRWWMGEASARRGPIYRLERPPRA